MVALAIAGAVAIAPVLSGCGAGREPQTAAPTQLTEGVNASVPKGAASPQVDIRNMFLLGPRPNMQFDPGSSVPLYATIINQVRGREDSLIEVSSPAFAQARIAGDAVVLPAAQEDGTTTAVTLSGAQEGSPARPTGTAEPGSSGERKEGGEASPSASPTTTKEGDAASPTATPRATVTPQGEKSPSPTPSAGQQTGAAQTTAPGAADATPAPGGRGPLVVLTGLNRRLIGGEVLQVTLRFKHAGSIRLNVPVVAQQGEFSTYAPVSGGSPAPGATATPTAGEGAGATPTAGEHADAAPSGEATPAGAERETSTKAPESPAADGGH
ncbi:hypothetical protein [Actinomadura rubrobrunea]|nr:hypothetical protein [Actinomadura rubrobrunea]